MTEAAREDSPHHLAHPPVQRQHHKHSTFEKACLRKAEWTGHNRRDGGWKRLAFVNEVWGIACPGRCFLGYEIRFFCL